MENPLSGIMEWYQGLPQAAQIGIPVVGVGAVFLISRKGGGSGSLVSGPFGSSTGGGQAASGAGNAGGSDGGGGSPTPKPTPKPVPVTPKPVPGSGGFHPNPHPIPPVHPGGRPHPPGSGNGTHGGYRPPVGSGHKPLPVVRPAPLQRPHLPSSHIQSHPALAKPHLPSSHIMSTPNTKAAAVTPRKIVTPKTPVAGIRSGSLYEGGPTKVTSSKVTPAPAHHPVANRGLHNTVHAMKGHQYTNDQHKAASSVLAKRSNAKPTAL